MHTRACDGVTTMPADFSEVLVRARRSGLDAARCEVLSHQLPAAIASLWRRCAWEVPQRNLDDFVALGWMDWRGGALVLTPTGKVVHDKVVARGTAP